MSSTPSRPPLDATRGLVGNRYRIEEKLGGGGMGVVYRAVDVADGRAVALKRMARLKEGRRSAELRFRREFHSLASLRHPRIIEAYDYGVDEDGPFYTMEILDGRDLRDAKDIGLRELCVVLRDVAAALAFLHARGLVHRDVGPRNVRCTAEGRAKLIDFGVLGNVGLVGDLAGTLTYMAPEVFRGLPIDGRTDLYSLGVLAYLLLSGRAPYDVRGARDPELAFAALPPSLTSLGLSVPAALDDLLLALLSTDPLARPASAAELIDRLSALYDMPPLEDEAVVRGYLASVAMVGRQREVVAVRRRVLRSAKGRGGGIVLAGESGAGKSRLLREAQLEAKLAGCLVVRADSEASARGPYGVLEQLARGIFLAAPTVAAETSRPFADALAIALPGLALEIGPVSARGVQVDPGEERMRVQRALLDWLLAVAANKPLVLVVDDVQRCDEASCAVFAALLRENKKRPLLTVFAQRTNEQVRAKAAMDLVRDASKVMVLAGLDAQELKELLIGLFGDVPNVDRLALLFENTTGGSPLFATELARQLVDSGVVRFVGGAWVIPDELPRAELPSGLAAAVDARLARLTPSARRLGETLALHGGDLPLDLLVALGRSTTLATDEDVFEALDVLAREGVLVGDRGVYRFRHDGFREGLQRALDDDAKRTLHRDIGKALLAEGDVDAAREAKVGWHLLEGGDEDRGADLLRRSGIRLFEAQALADCIAPLEAALAVLERRGATTIVIDDLTAKLLAAGWVSNRAVGTKYALRAVLAWQERCGFASALRYSRYVGLTLGLVLGFSFASLRWVLGGGRGASPLAASTTFFVSLGYACGLANAESRIDDLHQLIALAKPASVFPRGMPRGIYQTFLAFPDIILGHIGRGARRLTSAVELIRGDRFAPVKTEEKAFAEIGVRGLRLLLDVNQFDRRVDEDLAAIDASPFRYYHLVAEATRVVRHRYRGEEERAKRIERKMETASVQLGSWSTDVQVLFFAHPAYALCHDVLGLRRSLEKLEALVAQGFRIEMRVAITRADYLRERGDAAGAVATMLAAMKKDLRPDDLLMRQWGGSSLAEALLAAGEISACIDEARAVYTMGKHPDSGVVLAGLRAARSLGLALSARGEHAESIVVLDEATLEAERLDCAPLAGALHEARARVALATGDRERYGEHGAEAIRWLRPTRNPSLIAMCERLVEAGQQANLGDARVEAEWVVTIADSAGASSRDHTSSSRSSSRSEPSASASDRSLPPSEDETLADAPDRTAIAPET